MKLYKQLATWQLLVLTVVVAGLISFGSAFALAALHKKNSNGPSKCNVSTCVSLYGDKASPDTITVKLHSYVQFNSADSKSHDLSIGGTGAEHHSHNAGSFESGVFKADEAWKVQFNEEGTYSFKDSLNPKVQVLVVVYTPDKQYKVE
jgi:plastocyanin